MDNHNDQENAQSSAEGTSRRDFIQQIVKRAAIAGSLLAAPKVIDKFLVPAAWAYGSSCASASAANADTAATGLNDTTSNNTTENTTGQGTGGTETNFPINNDTICSTNRQ